VLLRAVRSLKTVHGRHPWTIAIAALLLGVSSCARGTNSASQLDVGWTLRPQTPVVGAATLTITLRDRSGDRVTGAKVRLEAHMSHAGMAPVRAEATESSSGTYEIPFAFTMQGDWVLLASALAADGTRVEQRIDVHNVRPSK
jgi:hypothetical protein